MKILKLIPYLIFALLFFYISLWIQINLFMETLGKDKPPISIIEDQSITKTIKDKTGINIPKININETPHPYGMMIGIPGSPQLFLSRGLYKTFAKNEIEYVLLHEVGHYKYHHSLSELFLGLFFLVSGIFIIKKIKNMEFAVFFSIFFALFLGILMIQFGKLHEIEADIYTARNMTNPEGMINATNRFRSYFGKKYTLDDNKIRQFLFYRGNLYDNRIKMAGEEIERRKNL